ncbi:MAG: glutamate 5-kinase [Clostridia bacterium]
MNTKETIVIKVGTSTITYDSGKLNLRLFDSLCRVISDLQNSGKKIILVSSGAIGVGVGKLGLNERPESTEQRQALAAVGQCELMFMYDKIFGEYNRTVAQVLLTAEVINESITRKNVENTFSELLKMDIIPIVNENDTVATAELEGKVFGDNDTLSAIVACVANADKLIILTDTDGLYTANPKIYKEAVRIPQVKIIDDYIMSLAGESSSNRGTGGTITKIKAAKLATSHGIETSIIKGDDPENLYKILDKKDIGTVFTSQ